MRDSDSGCLQEWARLMSIMCILVFIRTLKRLVFLHRHWVFFRGRKTDVVMLNSAYVLSVGVIWLLWTLKDNITFLGLILVVSFEKSKEMGERVNWRRWRKEFCVRHGSVWEIMCLWRWKAKMFSSASVYTWDLDLAEGTKVHGGSGYKRISSNS